MGRARSERKAAMAPGSNSNQAAVRQSGGFCDRTPNERARDN